MHLCVLEVFDFGPFPQCSQFCVACESNHLIPGLKQKHVSYEMLKPHLRALRGTQRRCHGKRCTAGALLPAHGVEVRRQCRELCNPELAFCGTHHIAQPLQTFGSPKSGRFSCCSSESSTPRHSASAARGNTTRATPFASAPGFIALSAGREGSRLEDVPTTVLEYPRTQVLIWKKGRLQT